MKTEPQLEFVPIDSARADVGVFFYNPILAGGVLCRKKKDEIIT